MKLIIGNTGLVGKTLCESNNFDLLFNTSNIDKFEETVVDGSELYLSCLPATKWLVNKNLKSDFDNINNIINVLSKKKYSKIILISTIDIYNDSPLMVDEDYNPNISKLNYGNNRYIFELLIKEYLQTDDLKIFRLPALYNKHIKKNILYDLINNNNINQINLNSSFQWYNLDNLTNDIEMFSTMYPDKTIFNLFTEPINTIEIVKLFKYDQKLFKYSDKKIDYNYTTKYTNNGYIMNKNDTIKNIKNFINGFINK